MKERPYHLGWRPSIVGTSLLFVFLLCVGSWTFVLFLDRSQPHPFFSSETWRRASLFLQDLLGIGSTHTPAFLRSDAWMGMAGLAYDTLLMSILAISLTALGVLAVFMFGARNVMIGELAPHRNLIGSLGFLAVRSVFTVTRAIPELVWAMLIIFILTPGIFAGAIALAIHNFGILGKLAAEVVEGLDTRPAQALRSAGAGKIQLLLYSILPQALPRFLTYTLYRWEVIIRTTIVVGFVAAGGLGMEFRLAMSRFDYTTVTLIILWYLILVIGVDLVAAALRRISR
jgi:phosphonate transport system permease protein